MPEIPEETKPAIPRDKNGRWMAQITPELVLSHLTTEWASTSDIARKTGFCSHGVIKILKSLQMAGKIEKGDYGSFFLWRLKPGQERKEEEK